MKQAKNLFPPAQSNAIQTEIVLIIVGALLVASSIGTVMVMIVSHF